MLSFEAGTDCPGASWRGLLRHVAMVSVLALLASGCARRAADPIGVPLSRLGAHAVTDTIAPGLIHHALRFDEGPWMVHVLDIDLRSCWQPVALKAGAGAIGRTRTTQLLEQAVSEAPSGADDGRQSIAAGVNADFFRFNPPGLPVAAHISGGRVIAGPSRRPVVAFDEAGTGSIEILEDSGFVVIADDTLPLSAWNRSAPEGLALFDENWGAIADSATGTVELIVGTTPSGTNEARSGRDSLRRRGGAIKGVATAIDTLPAGVAPGNGRVILIAGARAPASMRAKLLAVRSGVDSVHLRRWIQPGLTREAVGGFPVLVRRGAVAAGLDSAGGRGFGPVRHPRTAVGLSRLGTRLLLVTVDGRQPGYSVGMTLPELAQLMLNLGSTAALNLDGGGSTTMAVSAGRGETRILNRPSDTSGERPVSNALAVVHSCGHSSGVNAGSPERVR